MSDLAVTLEEYEIPQGWALASFADIAIDPKNDIVDGPFGSNLKASEYTDSGVPILRLQNIKRNYFLDKNIKFVTHEKYEQLSRHTYEAGDLIVTKLGDPLGVACIAPQSMGKGVIVADLVRARLPEELIDKKYVAYLINSPIVIQQFKENTKGTTRPRVNLKFVRALQLPIAPYHQQKRIVAKIEELFSHIDAGVTALNKAKLFLKQYRQSVLKSAVTGELTKEWRERNKEELEPASELLDRILKEQRQRWEHHQLEKFKAKGKIPENDNWKEKYKEPPVADFNTLPGLPAEWQWATLPQLGELNRGKSKHRPRNDPILYGGEYPFVQTGDVRAANGWLTSYEKTYSETGLEQSRLWPKGTLCITIAANIADTAVLGIDACFPDSVVGFIPHDESINVELLEFFIRTVKDDLEKYAPATAQKNINLGILETVGLPLLPVKEQTELVTTVKNKLMVIQRLETEIDNKLIRVDRNKQSILVSAFNGSLVKRMPGDGNASDLLQAVRERSAFAKKNKNTDKADKQKKEEEKSVSRRSLISILEENEAGLSPDSLMKQAGYTMEEVDSFYQKLSEISSMVEEVDLSENDIKNWPYDKSVKLKLRGI